MPKNVSQDRTLKSYNRLLQSGIIKKDVYDNRIQKFSSKTPSIMPFPNNTTKPTQSSNLTKPTPSSNPTKPLQCCNSNIGGGAGGVALGAISNQSGQYPMNGAPGKSMR